MRCEFGGKCTCTHSLCHVSQGKRLIHGNHCYELIQHALRLRRGPIQRFYNACGSGGLIVGGRAAVAFDAVEQAANAAQTSLLMYNPGTVLERRAMPHVLIVSARQFGDPVAVGVGVEAGDCLLHCFAIDVLR